MLLLIHGLAGTGALWRSRELAPDLAGHGRAPRLARYDYATFADDLHTRLERDLAGQEIQIVGHSLGGVVAIELARRHPDLTVTKIVTVGVKTAWSDAEIAALHRVADKGVATFESEADARLWFLKVSGLRGVLAPEDDKLRSAVEYDGEAWRLATDPEVYRVAPVDFGALLATAPCPVVLARGEHDEMAPASDLDRFGLAVVTLAGLGHNAHVENTDAVLALV